ncbi:helix-turn-helix domain-containing protein [Salinicola rhizosphaerae]|uniref:Transcriptional regulator n=1 Tax=Salinicola rhizosphaerae TaxID=1443141 RepID=A0ABQ3DWR4_9GAMM|nr:helix-turn-helix domain-containing protein [Salinicola rhizosphaerae]GHB14705.1 transcriptional regulator [Salinicola rhizosphaerae]
MSSIFHGLFESVQQMDDIVKGDAEPSREFVVTPVSVRNIRLQTGLSQERFASLIDVRVATLRNWEQGRREPTGPARALLRAIHTDPRHVLPALAQE